MELENVRLRIDSLKADAEKVSNAMDEGDEKAVGKLIMENAKAVEGLVEYLEGLEERVNQLSMKAKEKGLF